MEKDRELSDKSSYHRIARKVWEEAHGERPFDDQGKRFEVHHIDGRYKNNEINNLLCVSPTTHREIHRGNNLMINIRDLKHVMDNSTPEFIAIDKLSILINTLKGTMIELGSELTDLNGGREGWEDLVELSDESLDDDAEYDLTMNRAYRFIWRVAYPIALNDLNTNTI